jgi:outer membrane protein OmpA-like peptidoglycan-associated protein
MPIFYNPASPTPTTKNTINDVSVGFGIRDFLLNLNLAPQYPQIATNINGSPKIGQPVLDTTVGTGNILIPIGLPLNINGIIWKDLNVIYNTFQNDPNVANILEDIDYIPALSNPDFVGAIWPTNSQYPTGANTQVEQYGIKGKTEVAQYRQDNVTRNLYLDATSQIDVADFITLNPLNISQQLGNYLDVFGGLNQGGAAGDQAINVIGSVLNGQGVGLGAGGSVVPNFDFKSSLLGRVLGGAGFVKDTKLGNVGAQQLSLALANNAAFNVQQDILGALNIKENIYSLIKDGELAGFRPNYKITIPKSTGGQILNGITRVLGFQIPRSYLDDDGSIFQSENGDVANIDRANSMILNTGKGQVKSLITNVIANSSVNSTTNPFRSGYAPAYKDNKGQLAITSADTKVYAYSIAGNVDKILGNAGDIIPELNYNREALTEISGFKSPEQTYTGPKGNNGYDNKKISDIGFTWTTGNGNSVNKVTDYDELDTNGTILDKKSLLVKTQKLFNSKGMKTLVSVKGEMGYNSTQIQTANNDGISKGSAVLSKNRFDLESGVVNSSGAEAGDNFCRSWTTLDRYDSVKKLIRNKPLYKDPDAPYRFKTNGSVLDGPFVKIAPYAGEVEDPKKFMFSIENLAWKDNPEDLPPCEVGPGDLVSGEKGRIMWFPPYDIQFSESSSVNWEETNFIGRGEPIFTYNNTKRTGQLSFKIIVDHPSYFNAFNAKRNATGSPDDNYIASFFAGCVDTDKRWVDKLLKKENIDKIETETVLTPQVRQDSKNPDKPDTMSVYYPNDVKVYEPEYEDAKCSDGSNIDYQQNCDGGGCGLGTYKADVTQKDVNGKTVEWPDRFDYGLNAGRNSTEDIPTFVIGKENAAFGFNDQAYGNDMVTFLKECPWSVVNFQGFASPQGNPNSNTKLAEERAKLLREKLIAEWGGQLGLSKDILEKRFKLLPGKALTKSDVPLCPVETAQSPNPPVDIIPCKLARRVEISVTFDATLKADYEKALAPLPDKKTYKNFRLTGEIRNKFYSECDYFERMISDYEDENGNVISGNKFVFDSIREKIRYFHPAFHSTTPEGLNSRLTFLLQCTRQGPTLESVAANNLAFGRPPICILRIGDFYNTKIAIDNVNISYEPLVWDLNPEGVGVQPMIANVDLSFNFLGGSSLMGPINKLQNALSFNYFANTQVYDPRADYIAKKATAGVGPLEGQFEQPLTAGAAPTSFTQGSEFATEPSFNYKIVDGKSYRAYIESLNNSITRELINDTEQASDQVKNEEAVNSGPTNQEEQTSTTTGDTENDIKVINGFGFDKYLKIDETETEDLIIGFIFQFQPVRDTKVVLTKGYSGKLYIQNNATREKKLIDTIRVSPNNSSSVEFKLESDRAVIVDLDNKIKFNFSADVSIQGDEPLVSFIKTSYVGSDSSLVIEWETGGKPQIGWNKTIAKSTFSE